MNCEIVQRRLLSITNPECVPAHLRAHLAYCAACREWHSQLLVLEQHVRLLPVPASNGKSKLMRRLLSEKEAACHTANMRTKTHSSSATLSLSQTATLAHSRKLILGSAAALLFLALGWLGLQSWLHQ